MGPRRPLDRPRSRFDDLGIDFGVSSSIKERKIVKFDAHIGDKQFIENDITTHQLLMCGALPPTLTLKLVGLLAVR